MSRKKQFAVVGLGRFGETVALELMRLGHDVLGIDTRVDRIEAVADELTRVVNANASDEQVLDELDIDQFDAVLVAIGENIEGSILTTLALKSAGVRKLWVKALNDAHHRIVTKLGADRIIHPEFEMGIRVAQSLDRPDVRDYISLGNDNFIVQIQVRESLDSVSVGQFLSKCENKAEVLVLRQGGDAHGHPDAARVMHEGDQLVLLGKLADLRHLSDLM